MFKKIGNFFSKVRKCFADFFFKNRYGTVMLLIGGIVAFWDLILKFLLDGKNFPALKGIFNIYSTHNTGGAWSIFSNNTVLLVILTIVFLFIIVLLNYSFKKKDYFYAISMGLLLGGAICNLYDRIKFGYVRDFINLEFINFPVFNIADIAITIGVILIAVYFLFISPKYDEKQDTIADESALKFIDNYHIIKENNKVDEDTKNNQIAEENSLKIVDNYNTINKKTENKQNNTKKIKNNSKNTKNKLKNNSNKSVKNVKAKNAK